MLNRRRIIKWLACISVLAIGFIALGNYEAKAACSGHTYTWVTEKNPTCASDGYRNYKCTKCGNIANSASIPKVNSHSYNIGSATCSQSKVCTVCGHVAQNATGHSYSWVTVSNPTCTSEGYREYRCSKCQIVQNSSSISRVSHSPNMSSATCTENKVCTMCGCTLQSKTGHNYTDQYYTKKPTCTEGGAMLQKCSGCGDTKTVSVGKTGHSFNGQTKKVEPTCTEDGYTAVVCSKCSTIGSKSVIGALGHQIDEAVYTVVKEPTETSTGTGRCFCKRSGCSYYRDITLPMAKPKEKEDPCKNGHINNGAVTKVDSTCYSEGYQIQLCSRCGVELGSRTVIPKKSHNWGSGKLLTSTDGYEIYEYRCTNSGCSESKTEKKEKKIDDGNPCKNGHASNGVQTKVDSTCYSEGYQVLKCTRCGAELGNRTPIAKKEHKWDNGTVITSGDTYDVYKYKCLNPGCNEVKTENKDKKANPGDNVSQPHQPDPSECLAGHHDWSDYVETSIATCKMGAVYTRRCTIYGCGATETYTGPVGDHLFRTIDDPATCVKVGHSGQECCFCGKLLNYKEMPMVKHKYTKWECIQKENCYLMGNYVRHCTVCNHYDYKKVNKTTHVAKNKYKVITEATCTKEGVKVKYCKNCGKEMDKVTIPAKGHNVLAWTPYKDPKTGKSMSVGSCKYCGELFTRETSGKKKTSKEKMDPLPKIQYTFTPTMSEEKLKMTYIDPETGKEKSKKITIDEYYSTYMYYDPSLTGINDENRAAMAIKGFYGKTLGTEDAEALATLYYFKQTNYKTDMGKTLRDVSVTYKNMEAAFAEITNSKSVYYSRKAANAIGEFTGNKKIKALDDAISNLEKASGKVDKVANVFAASDRGEETAALIGGLSSIVGKMGVGGSTYSDALNGVAPSVKDVINSNDQLVKNFCNWSKLADYDSQDPLWNCSLQDIADGASGNGNNAALEVISSKCNNQEDMAYFLEERTMYELKIAYGELSKKTSFYEYYYDKYCNKASTPVG